MLKFKTKQAKLQTLVDYPEFQGTGQLDQSLLVSLVQITGDLLTDPTAYVFHH